MVEFHDRSEDHLNDGNGETFIPATQTEDKVTRLPDVDVITNLIKQERETLKSENIDNQSFGIHGVKEW